MRSRRLLVGLLIAAAAGCSTPPDYPTHLQFTPRQDRLVLKLPDQLAPPPTLDRNRMDEEIAALDSLGGRTLDPATLPSDERQTLAKTLFETFGTPAAPAIRGDAAYLAIVDELGLAPDRLAQGSKLFHRHCLQCHGLNGDGRGPTGPWIYPHPRDFRRGSFKFTSTGDSAKPRRADLMQTITAGMKGTAMPPFAMLPEETRDLLAGFVMFLAIRGQVEYQSLVAIANGEADGDVPGFARDRLHVILREWQRAAVMPASPPPGFEAREGPEHEASVRRGYVLFTSQGGAGCAACHEDFGRKAAHRYDVWGTVVRPADLTANAYKSGSRDVDFFRRIRGGIAAAGMPANPTLTDAQVWDLVRFVRSAPHPRDLPPDVREKVEAKP